MLLTSAVMLPSWSSGLVNTASVQPFLHIILPSLGALWMFNCLKAGAIEVVVFSFEVARVR